MKSSRYLVMLVLVAVCAALVAGTGAQEDGDEAEEPALNLPVLAEGEVFTGEFDVNNPLHARLFAFGATEGDTVTIAMTTADADSLDPFLLVYGPTGQLVAVDDDSGAVPDALVEELKIVESGNYYILATSYDVVAAMFDWGADLIAESKNPELIGFELAVAGNTGPEAEHIYTQVEVGASVDLEITEESYIGYVVFEAAEGDVVSLSASSEEVDTLLYLFDAEGYLLAVNDDADFEGEDTNSQIADIEIAADGLYLAFVTVIAYDSALYDPVYETGVVTFAVE